MRVRHVIIPGYTDGEEELALYVFDSDGGAVSHTMYVRYMTGAFAAISEQMGLLQSRIRMGLVS